MHRRPGAVVELDEQTAASLGDRVSAVNESPEIAPEPEAPVEPEVVVPVPITVVDPAEFEIEKPKRSRRTTEEPDGDSS